MKIRDVLDILSSSEIILEVDVIVLVEEAGKAGSPCQGIAEEWFSAASKRGSRKGL